MSKVLNEKQVANLIKAIRETADLPRESCHGIGVASGMNISANLVESFFEENAQETDNA